MPKLIFSKSFQRDLKRLPAHLQDAVEKQIQLLITDRTHPSLQLKKMKGYENVWEIRISHGDRITFSFFPDSLVFHRVGPHDIVRNPV